MEYDFFVYELSNLIYIAVYSIGIFVRDSNKNCNHYNIKYYCWALWMSIIHIKYRVVSV